MSGDASVLPAALAGRVTVVPARGDAAAPRPLVLVLPGGGYRMTADHEAEPVAEWLAGLGLHAVVLRYRVAPEGATHPLHPAPLDDATAAVRWVRAGGTGLDVDPARVGVLGFSAGGHLAATLSTVEDADVRPDATVLCYPVVSFGDETHEGSVEALLGAGADADARAALSAERRVTAATPPAFVWHTADDDAVPVSNAVRYARALWAVGAARPRARRRGAARRPVGRRVRGVVRAAGVARLTTVAQAASSVSHTASSRARRSFARTAKPRCRRT